MIKKKRRSFSPDFKHDTASLVLDQGYSCAEAGRAVENILKSPEPYVWITDFQRFAVEYTLYVYIDNPQKIQMIDSSVRAAIFESSKRHGIDISTPNMIKSVK